MAGSDINIKMKLDGESEFRRQIKECNAEMKNMQSALKLVDAEAQGEANSIDNLRKKQEALDNVLKAATHKQEALSEAYQNATKNQQQMLDQLEEARELYGENSKEVDKAEQAYSNATQKVNDWERQLNNARVEVINVNAALEENASYIQEATDNGTDYATSIDEYGKKTKTAAEETNQLLDVVSKSAALEAIKSLADEANEAFQNLGNAAHDAMIEVDAGYDIIITKTGASGEALQSLEESANNVFQKMPTDIQSISIAIGEVNTRFGATGAALEYLTELFIQFSEINGTDLNTSIDQVDRILTQYGGDIEDVIGFLGQLTKVSQNTGKSTSDLLSGLDQNASVFKTFGISLEEAINLFGKFEDNGVQASTAIAGLRKAASKYSKEGDDMRTGLEKTIVAIRDASDVTEAYAIAQETFGNKGFTAMTDAIRDGRFSLEDLNDSFSNYTDTVQSTYTETKNVWDEWTVAQNNLTVAGSELAAEFHESMAPATQLLSDVVKDATSKFQSLPEPMQDVLGMAGGLTIEAGKLAPELLKCGSALTSLLSARRAAQSLKEASDAASATAGSMSSLAGSMKGIAGAAGIAAAIVIATMTAVDKTTGILLQDVDELKDSISVIVGEMQSDISMNAAMLESAGAGADKYAAATKALNGAQKTTSELAKKNAEAQGKLTTVYEDSRKAVEESDDAWTKFAWVMTNTSFLAKREAKDSTEKLTSAIEESSKALDEAKQAEREYISMQADAVMEMENANEATREITAETLTYAQINGQANGTIEEAITALGELSMAHNAAREEITAEIQSIEGEMQQLQQDYDNAYQAAYNSLEGQFGLFEKVTVEAKTSVADMNAALESQMQFMTDYGTNLKKAAEMGVSEGLIKQLSDGSVESAQYLQAIVDSGGEGIDQLNRNFEKVENGKQAMSKIMAENVTDFSNKMSALESRMNTAVDRLNKADAAYVSGAQTIQGYIRGSEAYRSAIIAEYTSLANAANDAWKRTLQQHSPSKVFEANGMNDIKGAILGAEGMRKELTDTFDSLALAAAQAFNPAAYSTNISNYAGATTLNNQVAVYIGDKELTGYMATGVIKAISDNARNGYAGRRV